MDPNACLQRIGAPDRHNADSNQALADLFRWLQNGGFRPDWSRNLRGTRRFARRYGIAWTQHPPHRGC